MATCMDALRGKIQPFIDSLSRGDANNAGPVCDWRAKLVGFCDFEAAAYDSLPRMADNVFLRDASALKSQLAGCRPRATDGGGKPESLLDALFTVASMQVTLKGPQLEDAGKWRYRAMRRAS